MYIRILDIINFFIWDIKKKVFKVKKITVHIYTYSTEIQLFVYLSIEPIILAATAYRIRYKVAKYSYLFKNLLDMLSKVYFIYAT